MGQVTRRTFVGAAGLLATAGVAPTAARGHGAAASPPLVAAAIDVALVQAPTWATGAVDAARDRLRNAERMLESVVAAQRDGRRHWVAFGDLALDGIVLDDPHDAAAAPLDAGDAALRLLARGAGRHGCWLSFGARVRLRTRAGGTPSRALVMLGPGGELHALAAGAAARGAVLRTPVGNVALGTYGAGPVHDHSLPPGTDVVIELTSAWARHAAPGPGSRSRGAFTARIGGALPRQGPPELCTAASPGITALHAPDGSPIVAAVDCAERIIAGTLPLAEWRASRQVG